MVIHNNFQDFVLFLYIHMGHADGFLHPTEEEVILHKMSKIFPSEGNTKKKLEDAIVQYRKLDQGKVMEIIKATFKHFDQVKFAAKYKVYTDMYDIVNADGKIEESETLALETLKEIINMNSEAKQAS